MALIIPGSIVSSIHGSIGGTTYQKSGPFQIARQKPLPKNSCSFKAGQSKCFWSSAHALAHSNYTASKGIKFDIHADNFFKTREGINYKLTSYQFMVALYRFGLLTNDSFSEPLLQPNGIRPNLPFFVYIYTTTKTIWSYSYVPIPANTYILLWWTRPYSSEVRKAPKKYDYFKLLLPGDVASQFLQQLTISGKCHIYYKYKTYYKRSSWSQTSYGSYFRTLP